MAKESFNVQKNRLKLNNQQQMRDYLEGKTIEILSNTSSHSYGPVGTKLEFTSIRTASISGSTVNYGIPGGNSIRFTEFRVVIASTPEEIKEEIVDLEKQVADLKELIKENKSKISFMKENGIKSFDENEFKVFKTLEALEDPTTTRVQKAKIIAEMISS